MKSKNTKIMVIIISILVVAIGLLIWYLQFKRPHDIAITKYNNATAIINDKNSKLDAAINNLQKVIDTNEKPFDDSALTNAQTVIKSAKKNRIDVPKAPRKTYDIIAETQKLSAPIDYSSTIAELNDAFKSLENSIKQMKQVINPTGKFVIQRLQTISGITGVQAVTEDNDPNGNLNKPGGYTATIYFSINLINQNEVYGTDIVDKGTDCGGAVEVYASKNDAEKRNTYLSSFDGATMLNSGSHTVAGTVVVRTSSKLTASQQKELEKQVIDSLIALQ